MRKLLAPASHFPASLFTLALAIALLAPTGSAQSAPPPSAPAATAAQSAPAAAAKPSFAYDAAKLAALVPTPRPEDVRSPENIISACYAVISGPPGPRDWDRFRSLFIPQARLTASHQRKDGSTAVTLLGVSDYVALAGSSFLKTGFFEASIHNDTNRYGNIAQVFSSYESRHAITDAAPFARGINSFQLVYDGSRWWVVSILWDEETPSNPIPPEFDKH
jgi:hypothetical protein